MPINADYKYVEAQKKLEEAKTTEEKIRALEAVLSASPDHKGAQKLRQEIKTKIAKLKVRSEKERDRKSGYSISIKKEGAAQVVLLGLTNSGKSTILSKITNYKPLIAEYEFTTKKPEIGIMDYEGIKIQIIELPAIFPGFYESDKGPSYLGIAKSADLIIIVLDGTKNCEEDLKLIEKEFYQGSLYLKKIKGKNHEEAKNCLVIINKNLQQKFNCPYNACWVDDIKRGIWNLLGLIYVYTKQPGKPKDHPPVALEKGNRIKDLASIVHKDFIANFRYARVWGKSVKHNAATVGLDHKLQEGDIVELHLK